MHRRPSRGRRRRPVRPRRGYSLGVCGRARRGRPRLGIGRAAAAASTSSSRTSVRWPPSVAPLTLVNHRWKLAPLALSDFPRSEDMTTLPSRMAALLAREQDQAPDRMSVEERSRPEPRIGDVLIQVGAASFTPTELQWPSTWVDRSGRGRQPVIPGHEVSGTVVAIGYGTTGFGVGDEVNRPGFHAGSWV